VQELKTGESMRRQERSTSTSRANRRIYSEVGNLYTPFKVHTYIAVIKSNILNYLALLGMFLTEIHLMKIKQFR